MFAKAYFPGAYWPAAHWPQSGAPAAPLGGAGTRVTGVGSAATVQKPLSPFSGGVSQSWYSDAEADYDAFVAAASALSDPDLITAATTSRDALQTAVENVAFQPSTLLPEDYYHLEVYNAELRARGLPQITILR